MDDASSQIDVSTAPPAYLRDSMHPAYKNSMLVSNAAMASRLIVTTSGHLSSLLQSSAETFTHKTKTSPKPITFTPTAHERVRKLNNLTQGAVGLSAKTVGQVTRYAQNFGATLARRSEKPAGQSRGMDKDGQPIGGYKPGILNKSMMAFSTIADGVDQAGRNLLASGSTAATTVVSHRFGQDAGVMAKQLTGGVKNVGLVYIDVTGVSRKAIIKSVAKGMVIGKVKGGGDLIVGGGDGGVMPPLPTGSDTPAQTSLGGKGGKAGAGIGDVVGFGPAGNTTTGQGNGQSADPGALAPPYREVMDSSLGEPLDGAPAYPAGSAASSYYPPDVKH